MTYKSCPWLTCTFYPILKILLTKIEMYFRGCLKDRVTFDKKNEISLSTKSHFVRRFMFAKISVILIIFAYKRNFKYVHGKCMFMKISFAEHSHSWETEAICQSVKFFHKPDILLNQKFLNLGLNNIQLNQILNILLYKCSHTNVHLYIIFSYYIHLCTLTQAKALIEQHVQ